MSTRSLMLVALCSLVATQTGCELTDKGTSPPAGTPPPAEVCNRDVIVPLSAHEEHVSDSEVECAFSAVNVQTGNCTVVRTTVTGGGNAPSQITVERSGSSADVVGALPSVSGSWQATGAALNCNTPLGCGTGDYAVTLTFPASVGACPDEDHTLAVSIQ